MTRASATPGRGALAVGMGIMYTGAATRWEIVEVFREAARAQAPVHVHMRYNGTREPLSSTTALQEVLSAALTTGAPLHVVHLHSTSLGATARHLKMIEGAHEHGLDVTTECYPYTAGMTDIASGVFDEGWREAMGIDYKDLLWADTGERLTAETFAARRQTAATWPCSRSPRKRSGGHRAPAGHRASDAVMKDGKGHTTVGGHERTPPRRLRPRAEGAAADGSPAQDHAAARASAWSGARRCFRDKVGCASARMRPHPVSIPSACSTRATWTRPAAARRNPLRDRRGRPCGRSRGAESGHPRPGPALPWHQVTGYSLPALHGRVDP